MKKIKISLKVDFDSELKRETVKEVELSIEEAQKQLQAFLDKMDYKRASKYVKKWS